MEQGTKAPKLAIRFYSPDGWQVYCKSGKATVAAILCGETFRVYLYDDLLEKVFESESLTEAKQFVIERFS